MSTVYVPAMDGDHYLIRTTAESDGLVHAERVRTSVHNDPDTATPSGTPRWLRILLQLRCCGPTGHGQSLYGRDDMCCGNYERSLFLIVDLAS